MRFLRPTSYPIGIDIGTHGVRMLQLDVVKSSDGNGDSPRVIAASRAVWPDAISSQFENGRSPQPAMIAPLLHRMASQSGFQGRDVVVSLPRESVQIKSIRLPSMPVDDLVRAAELEARGLFGFGPEDATVCAIPAGEVRQGSEIRHEVIVVGARRTEIDALVEAWHAEGFRPAGIDMQAAALYRSVERFVRRRDDEDEVNVLAEIGVRRTNVIIGRGRELSFFKAFEIGGAMLTNAVARKLAIGMSDATTLRMRLAETHEQVKVVGVDPVRQAVTDGVRPIVEEMAREIALCLRYFSVNFRGQRPSRVRLVGGESSDPTVVQLLANSLPVPVEAGRPIANADLSRMKAADRTGAMGEWTQAFGLALKFAKGNFADRLGIPRGAPVMQRAGENSSDGSLAAVAPATASATEVPPPTAAAAAAGGTLQPQLQEATRA